MKNLTDKLAIRLTGKCIDCFNAIEGLQPKLTDEEIVREMEIRWARAALKEASDENEKRKALIDLIDLGATPEIGEDEDNYSGTFLFRKIRSCFDSGYYILKARRGEIEDIDPELAGEINRALIRAKRKLEILHRDATPEIRDITASALKEFAAMELLARSDELISREQAHFMLAKRQRGVA